MALPGWDSESLGILKHTILHQPTWLHVLRLILLQKGLHLFTGRPLSIRLVLYSRKFHTMNFPTGVFLPIVVELIISAYSHAWKKLPTNEGAQITFLVYLAGSD